MAINVMRRGDRIKINTSNPFGSYNYTVRVYETPDGETVGVPEDDLSQTAKEEAREHVDRLDDEPPERYQWRGEGPNQSHDGIFTIEEKVGETRDLGANVYETDCGRVITTTDLEVGETYETYQKDARHFGYRTVDTEEDQ